jgi:ABC-type multidrug transport system ATPase subunit
MPRRASRAYAGPSGCGKSTLLDMIADVKTAPYEGTVYFNGRPRDASFRLVSSYVPQEDIGFEHSTVREIIQFHQRLKADVARRRGNQPQARVDSAQVSSSMSRLSWMRPRRCP